MAYYITKLTVEVKNPLDNDEEGHTNLLARGGGDFLQLADGGYTLNGDKLSF